MTKSDDISENLRKEENEQWHRRYEAKIQEAIEKLSGLIEHKEWIEIKETVETIMETVQNMAFMEGYMYAIAVLQEGLVNIK